MDRAKNVKKWCEHTALCLSPVHALAALILSLKVTAFQKPPITLESLSMHGAETKKEISKNFLGKGQINFLLLILKIYCGLHFLKDCQAVQTSAKLQPCFRNI